jgi:hypothetical protein
MAARPSILVDIYDLVQFWTFDKQFATTNRSRVYPPEHTHFQQVPPTAGEGGLPNITPKADIYLLGMALWYLAMGYPAPKTREGLAKETHHLTIPFEFQHYGEGGSTPVVLPPLPESIPKYYREIVEGCRSTEPNDRPPAWRLLERFP